tara:strand:- start:173 stop:559 length:387 start_codon:yes stop_codon:yes gene_type:complete
MQDWIKRAKDLMKQQKKTQEDVAKAMGKTTRGAVGHYFTGRSKPTMEQVQELAKFLKVSFTELVDGPSKIDEDTLEICLQLIEEAVIEAGVTLSDKQKAKMVTYLYKLDKDGKKVNNLNAIELVKLYS